jgi:hypothetical protein
MLSCRVLVPGLHCAAALEWCGEFLLLAANLHIGICVCRITNIPRHHPDELLGGSDEFGWDCHWEVVEDLGVSLVTA